MLNIIDMVSRIERDDTVDRAERITAEVTVYGDLPLSSVRTRGAFTQQGAGV